MQGIYAELNDIRQQMVDVVDELRELGLEKSRKEASYQRVKNRRALELKAGGMPATMVQMLIKGDVEVNSELLERECANALYDAAFEQLNVLKLNARLIESEIERQWNDAKRM